MKRRAWLFAFAFSVIAGPAMAEPVRVASAKPEKVAVTIYREGQITSQELRGPYIPDGLVLVRETRTITLPAGLSKVSFANVADRIVPQSAAIEGLPKGARERNFDYDVLSPGALMEKSIGESVRVISTNPRTGVETERRAIIRGAPQGVMLEVDGKLEALHCSGGPEKIVFDRTPERLSATPTLSVLIDAPKAGTYPIKLSYLAYGLNWAADYVAKINPDGKTLDLSGWITLANNSDTTFAQAPTEVVAGTLNRVSDEVPAPRPVYAPASCWPIGSGRMQVPYLRPPPPPPPAPMMAIPSPMAEARMMDKAEESVEITGSFARQRDLGDYKLYEVPAPTTVAARQMKQVRFLDQRAVPFKRLYQYEVAIYHGDDESAAPSSIVLRLKNDVANKLGKPLPNGAVAVFEPTAKGGDILTGEDRVSDTPIGLPIDWVIGKSSDVRVLARDVAREEVRGKTLKSLEVTIENHRAVAADVEIVHQAAGDYPITSESKKHFVREGKTTWAFNVPAGGKAVLRYAYRER